MSFPAIWSGLPVVILGAGAMTMLKQARRGAVRALNMQEKPQASTVNGEIYRFFIIAMKCPRRLEMTSAKTNRSTLNEETKADPR